MSITAQDINKLRQQTGAGMMDCKKSLTEAQGDIQKAIEILRKKGQKIAASRAGKDTTEGLVLAEVAPNKNYGVLIALSCETDFVAKNDLFNQLAQHVVNIALENRPKDAKALLQLSWRAQTVEEHIIEMAGKMGENIFLSAYVSLESEIVVSYVHMGNKLGVLVALAGAEETSAEETSAVEIGNDIAMQIAALNPLALDKEGIKEAVIEQELSIAREQALKDAKNPAMVENIAQGRLNKFFKDNTLLNQQFVKDNTMSVGQYLAKKVPGLKILDFKRVRVGEILEKGVDKA